MPRLHTAITTAAMSLLMASAAAAQGAKPLTKCAPVAVLSGTVCMDRYEASVWRVAGATTINKGLVKKIRAGKATVADLAKGGATQLGATIDDYAPCADSGQNCTNDVFALSLAGVAPSATVTWFQAQAACKNSAKRLPSNAEWQASVLGTPDPGSDNRTTDCHTDGNSTSPTLTGARSACVSADGAFDMVGNLFEWTADWAPASSECVPWTASVSPTGDHQCLQGALTGLNAASAIVRGGSFSFSTGAAAGPLTARARLLSAPDFGIGFRCAR